MAKNAKTLSLLLLIAVLGLAACQSNQVYQEVKDIPEGKWHKDNILSYNFTISDTLQPHHVFINIRNTTEYSYRNLYLFIETHDPAGRTVRDTFQCILADKKGRWYGKGWGDVYENKIPYQKFIRFPKSGTYSIEVQQAMRTTRLKHITDMGIIIEKAKKPVQ